MAKTIIGKVSVTPKGQYVSGTNYERLDIVSYQGTSYIAKSDNSELPTNNTYWVKLFDNYDTDIQELEVELSGLITRIETSENDIDSLENSITQAQSDIISNVNAIFQRALISETGKKIDLEINSNTFVLLAKLYDKNNNLISTSRSIDLPLETMVVNARYDSATKEIVLILKSGTEVRFSVADLVSGLQSEITSSNKLSSDLVDDTNKSHKFVSNTEKTTWNKKYNKPSSGIPKNDLSSDVQTSLDLADTAIQSHQDISSKEDKTNKVTTIDENSTDTEYPSAKAVYDYVGDIVGDIGTILDNINGESVGA